MHTRVCGIPCEVLVTYYAASRPACLHGNPDFWHPGEDEEIEIQILDRRGRAAPWLQAKMTGEDRAEIIRELHEYWRQEEATAIDYQPWEDD